MSTKKRHVASSVLCLLIGSACGNRLTATQRDVPHPGLAGPSSGAQGPATPASKTPVPLSTTDAQSSVDLFKTVLIDAAKTFDRMNDSTLAAGGSTRPTTFDYIPAADELDYLLHTTVFNESQLAGTPARDTAPLERRYCPTPEVLCKGKSQSTPSESCVAQWHDVGLCFTLSKTADGMFHATVTAGINHALAPLTVDFDDASFAFTVKLGDVQKAALLFDEASQNDAEFITKATAFAGTVVFRASKLGDRRFDYGFSVIDAVQFAFADGASKWQVGIAAADPFFAVHVDSKLGKAKLDLTTSAVSLIASGAAAKNDLNLSYSSNTCPNGVQAPCNLAYPGSFTISVPETVASLSTKIRRAWDSEQNVFVGTSDLYDLSLTSMGDALHALKIAYTSPTEQTDTLASLTLIPDAAKKPIVLALLEDALAQSYGRLDTGAFALHLVVDATPLEAFLGPAVDLQSGNGRIDLVGVSRSNVLESIANAEAITTTYQAVAGKRTDYLKQSAGGFAIEVADGAAVTNLAISTTAGGNAQCAFQFLPDGTSSSSDIETFHIAACMAP